MEIIPLPVIDNYVHLCLVTSFALFTVYSDGYES